MVETSAVHKKLAGNVALHLRLASERRFLRRNLRHVLDTHEHLLRRLTLANGTAPTVDHREMIANERRKSGWDYPTMEMLQGLMKGQKPLLRIEALQIRHPQSKARIEGDSSRRHRERDVDEDWLGPPGTLFSMPCTVDVGVADPATPKQRIYSEGRQATIRQFEDAGGVAHFDLELESPFLIQLGRLFTVQAKGSDPFRWKRTVTAKYTLDISVHCQDFEDTAKLLSRFECNDVSSYTPADGVLNASWENLPECPTAGQLLTLKRSRYHKGNKVLDPEYKIEVAMGWTRRKDTPLEQYNRIRTRHTRVERQLPTPSSEGSGEKKVEACEVVYKYQEGLFTRTMTVSGLMCPLCPNSLEQPSMERLRLHCATFHDHFKFELEDAVRPTRGLDRICHVVWMSVAEKGIEKERDKHDAEKINWIAPGRPFDVSAHLGGQDDWTGTRVRKSKSGRGRHAGTTRSKESTASGPTRVVRKRPGLDEIEDLPEQRPRKRRAPNVPSVQFYHPISKLAIPPSSLVTAGDDSVDQSWLQEKERHELDRYEVAGAKKEFIIAYNQHMEREQPDSIMFTREALVRFARNYRTQLRDKEWMRYFAEKLTLLLEHRIVTKETVGYCTDLAGGADGGVPDDTASGANTDGTTGSSINDTSDYPNGTMPTRNRKVWRNGKFVARDAAQREEDVVEQGGTAASSSGLCLCGKSASGERAALFCVNQDCVRKNYHLACVGLEKRIPSWRCADCSSQ